MISVCTTSKLYCYCYCYCVQRRVNVKESLLRLQKRNIEIHVYRLSLSCFHPNLSKFKAEVKIGFPQVSYFFIVLTYDIGHIIHTATWRKKGNISRWRSDSLSCEEPGWNQSSYLSLACSFVVHGLIYGPWSETIALHWSPIGLMVNLREEANHDPTSMSPFLKYSGYILDPLTWFLVNFGAFRLKLPTETSPRKGVIKTLSR